MFKYCLLCFSEHTHQKIGPHRLCRGCTYALSQTAVSKKRNLFASRGDLNTSYPLLTPFRYRSAIRTLILRAKVAGDQRALSFLFHLILRHPSTAKYLKDVDAITPAPSSLWGRLRGKLDLAHYLAFHLGEVSNTAVIPAPSQLFWNFQKRAKKGGRKLMVPHLEVSPSPKEGKTILVVDDVITSGHTLLETAFAIEQGDPSLNIKMLTLSDAT